MTCSPQAFVRDCHKIVTADHKVGQGRVNILDEDFIQIHLNIIDLHTGILDSLSELAYYYEPVLYLGNHCLCLPSYSFNFARCPAQFVRDSVPSFPVVLDLQFNNWYHGCIDDRARYNQ